MQNGAMKDWLDSTFLAGENQSYIEEIYEDYLTDPNSVDESWREIFQQLPVSQGAEQSHSQTRDYFRRLAKRIHSISYLGKRSCNGLKTS